MNTFNFDHRTLKTLPYKFEREFWEYLGECFSVNVEVYKIKLNPYLKKYYVSDKTGIFVFWTVRDNFFYYSFEVYPFYKICHNVYVNTKGVYHININDEKNKILIKELEHCVLL